MDPISIVFLLTVVFILLLATYVYTLQYAYRGMPPGPFNFPIIGSIPGYFALAPKFSIQVLIKPKPWEYLHLASKKYGPLFSGSCGKWDGVIITSYDLLKEVENVDEYAIKVCNELTVVRSMGKELGLIFAATPELWMEMRKFSQRTLRDFGFGKRYSMQTVIEAEITDLVKEFKAETALSGGILKIRTTFILSVLNVLWCMIAGQRYAHDDPKLMKMMEKNFGMTKSQTFIDPVHGFPWLKKILPKTFNVDYVSKVFEESHQYSQSLIEERRREGAYLHEPQNYIDCFIRKIEETKSDPKTVYTNENLQMMIEDFMQTGSTTSVGTLNYAVLFLTLNPSVQAKCQEEIDSIVPRHLTPTLDDIEKMPYFQATILETHRLGNVVPIPIPRVAPKDWILKGYTIPKGTIIISNHFSVHMDEDYWGDPRTFRPERFICKDTGAFQPDKHVCQFGFGKRYCIGVTLSNSVIPIYIATLLQNFTFSVPPGSEPPSMEPELGVSLSPKEFSVMVTSRP